MATMPRTQVLFRERERSIAWNSIAKVALLLLPQLSSDRLARSRTFEHPVTGFQVASVHSIALRSATRSRYFATDSRDACQTR